MKKLALAVMVSCLAGLGVTPPAKAATVTYTENATSGIVTPIPTSNPAITIASDGESPFDPFNAGYDTSDGIMLNALWAPDPAYSAAFAPGFWTQLPGTFTWVLPATTPCGSENEPACEPVAKWYAAGTTWLPDTPSVLLLEPDGSWSDFILVANNGPSGAAAITFDSDPAAVPLPGALPLFVSGLGALGLLGRRRKRKNAAISA
jgi:hypothetical protein